MTQPRTLEPVGEFTNLTLPELMSLGKDYLRAQKEKEIAMKNEEPMTQAETNLWVTLQNVLRSPEAGRDAHDLAFLVALEDRSLMGDEGMGAFVKHIAGLLKKMGWEANPGYAMTPQEYAASDRPNKVNEEPEEVGLSLADALKRPPMSAARVKQIADDLVRGPCGRPSPAPSPETVALSLATPPAMTPKRLKEVVAELSRHFPGAA